ncbi:MAG: RGCVC family protein [Catenulispora sp.]
MTAPTSRVPAPAEARCSCGHGPELHDHVAVRYCAATTHGGLRRGCICLMSFSTPAGRR